mgnify:FL=1
MNSIQEFWKLLLEHFEKTNSEFTFNHWIKPAEPIRIEQNILYIKVPSKTFARYWQDNLIRDIMEIGYDYFRQSFEPRFINSEDEGPVNTLFHQGVEEIQPNIPETPTMVAIEEDSHLNPKYTFETFIIGKGNQMATAAAHYVADNPGNTYNPLFFYGGVGLGKTHLMQAIGNKYKKSHPNARVKYVTSEEFMNEMIASIGSKTPQEFRNRYRNVDILLVDDIQFLAKKEATQEEFFHTFNALFNNQKQIVLTSDRQPTEIKELQERLVSRFVSGLSVDITPPDLETRIAILQNKATSLGFNIPIEVLSYVAGHIQSNVRELEGALMRLQAYSVMVGQDISTDLAAEALQSFLPGGDEKLLTVHDIQSAVAKYYNITVEDIKGKKRTKTMVQPRQIAMYLSRELTRVSLQKIGADFGRDHSTVIHAYEKISQEAKDDPETIRVINEIKHSLGY